MGDGAYDSLHDQVFMRKMGYSTWVKFFIKGGQNWILSQVEKIVLDERNKLLFIRPKTDNSFSTFIVCQS